MSWTDILLLAVGAGVGLFLFVLSPVVTSVLAVFALIYLLRS